MSNFLLNLFLSLLCLEIILHLFKSALSFFIPFVLKHISKSEDNDGEEFADETLSSDLEYVPRYDVEAFKERIKNITIDSDGLYTPPPEISPDLGVEILPEQSEIDIERYM